MTISSVTEELSTTRRKIIVTVSQELVNEAFQNATSELHETAEIKGFRKGKVPLNLFKKFYLNDIRKRSLDKVIDKSYSQAIKDANVQVVSSPKIEPVGEFENDQEFKYSVIVDINPQIDILGYKELSLKPYTNSMLNDEAIERTINNLRTKYAKFEKEPEARPVTAEDFVNITYSWQSNEPKAKKQSFKNSLVNLKEPNLPEDLIKAIIGMQVGESKEFDITQANPQHPDKPLIAHVHVTLNHLEKQILPNVDEGFAKMLGSNSVEDLQRSIRDSFSKMDEENKVEFFGEQIVEQLLAKNTFEVPEALVEGTIDRAITDMNSQLQKENRLDPKSPEARNQQRDSAVKQVQAILALGNVARLESIAVSDEEVGPALFEIARSYGIGIRELIDKAGRMIIEEARGRVLINKTIKHLIGINKIEEVSNS